jgi:hypothetical protein
LMLVSKQFHMGLDFTLPNSLFPIRGLSFRGRDDVDDILDADHVPSSVVDEEEPPLEQARAGMPPSPLPQNKGKGRARTPSKDNVIVRPRCTTQQISRRDPSRDNDRPRSS